jgi:hypothetical protein
MRKADPLKLLLLPLIPALGFGLVEVASRIVVPTVTSPVAVAPIAFTPDLSPIIVAPDLPPPAPPPPCIDCTVSALTRSS